jgi:uncharacterized protein YkwD
MLVDCIPDKAAIALVFAAGVTSCDLKLKIQPRRPKLTPIAKNLSTEILESTVFQQVNRYRVSGNLNPLKLDPRLSELAREHSRKMAKRYRSFQP